MVLAEQVVISHANVKQIARSDSLRIGIIVFSSRSGHFYSGGPVLGCGARSQRSYQSREYIPAKQASLHLLVAGNAAQVHRRDAPNQK